MTADTPTGLVLTRVEPPARSILALFEVKP